jgi:DNA-binding transcriptional LysR family regulator
VTLEQLRVFVAVAERLHMTRAAEALNMTQSAASSAVQALESRLGTALFDRVGRRLELTEAGRAFLPEAAAVLARAAQAEQVLDDMAGLARGTLRLHASQTVGSYWLPPYLHRFKQQHPSIALRLTIANTALVTQAVQDGSADLGFVEGDVTEPLLAPAVVGRDRLLLVAGASHPLASRSEVLRPADLLAADWVLRERGSGTRQVFESAMREHGVDTAALRIRLELPANEAVRTAVEAGAGVAALSELVAAGGIASARLVALPFPLPRRPFTALRHGDRHRPRAAEAFLALLPRAQSVGRGQPAPPPRVVPPHPGGPADGRASQAEPA